MTEDSVAVELRSNPNSSLGCHQIGLHQLTLLCNGTEFFPCLLAEIDAAKQRVYLETYIFADDARGKMVASALMRAAQRQVEVRLLLDGFGSASLSPSIIGALQNAGVQVLWFRRERGLFALRRKRLWRLHRKLVLIDQSVAFVGGINVHDEQVPHYLHVRLDYAVRIRGDVTLAVSNTMQRLWAMVAWANLQRRLRFNWPPLCLTTPNDDVQLLLRDNFHHRREIERAYWSAIAAAKSEILIANAYFLPGRKFRHALRDAKQRGVRVVLLLQGQVEYRLQHYATLALYDELLANGIEIYEYQKSFLHAKVAVIDQMWATVGSSNIDPFSLWLAREANLAVVNADFAQDLYRNLWQEIRVGAKKIEFSSWRRRRWAIHFILITSYALVRGLLGLIGYASEHDHY